ncbi:hypothetical protein RJ639_035162 [Escallonia herrerae]|uniref:F-box domain-containing protein n=1 Tax=Escallonia herrerae TaxID=1293975 RepID=A0AA88WRJ9_9ASTE|nr:hypothetical protein RJ639_035162 [Escallonia herrerae]
MPDLPSDVITDILTRLPVKSLLRSRCVSKPWCAMIDGPKFIKMHLDRSIETSSILALIFEGRGTLYSVEHDSLHNAAELDTPFENSNIADVYGSCNGLILLSMRKSTIAMFNPSTRRYHALPTSPVEYLDGAVGTHETYGLGYDVASDDYKVIRINEFRDKNQNWVSSEAKVYSLKSDSWRRIKDFPYCVPYKRVWAASVEGRLHTVVKQNWTPNKSRMIVAFDIGAEAFHLVPFPEFLDKDFLGMRMEVLEECLCLVGAYMDMRTDIWVMKDYGVMESWTKLISVVDPCIDITPLVYSKGRNEVLLNYEDNRLVWHDLVRKTVRNVEVRGLPSPFSAEVCVESLVSLPSGSIHELNKPHEQEKKRDKNRKKRCTITMNHGTRSSAIEVLN